MRASRSSRFLSRSPPPQICISTTSVSAIARASLHDELEALAVDAFHRTVLVARGPHHDEVTVNEGHGRRLVLMIGRHGVGAKLDVLAHAVGGMDLGIDAHARAVLSV